jgi:queuine/archaeosine tRNA-ribosyltransferase
LVQVTPSAWRSYVFACRPDIVIALSDTPFTKPPHSQKRLTKSLERSISWLSNLLRPIELDDDSNSNSNPHPLNVLVHMAGGTNIAARRIFSEGLLETLRDNEAESIKPLKRLDDGVTGYVFDLVPLRLSLAAELDSADTSSPDILDTTTAPTAAQMSVDTSALIPLMKTSLNPLPIQKVRLVNSAISPHEILRLVRDVGIDVFDAHWAQRAADIGVALDFRFPVVDTGLNNQTHRTKKELGHNLYDRVYAHDFTRLADCFMDGASSLEQDSPCDRPICPCAACSPLPPFQHILHSSIDSESYPESVHAPRQFLPPFRRAYLHHLLHTHEMSSHSLLAMHNLSVLDAFLSGVRTVLAHPNGTAVFTTEVDKFIEEYDEEMKVFEDARKSWTEVERARGKGRLAREKDKQAESTLGTAVEL